MWFFSRKHRLAYLQVPKSACTTIRFLMLELEQPGLVSDFLEKHSGKPSMRTYYEFFLQHAELLTPSVSYPSDASSFLRFSFVREPLQRCVSAYWNKICFSPPADADDSEKEYLTGINDHFFEQHYKPLGFEKDGAFDGFVQTLLGQPKERMDSHLVPQVSIVDYGGQHQVDFVGRIERFSDDIHRLFPDDVQALASVRFNEGDKPPVIDVREEVYRNLVDYYMDDYTQLRYEPVPPKGIQIV